MSFTVDRWTLWIAAVTPRSSPKNFSWTALPKEPYKTALKTGVVVAALFLLAAFLYRICRKLTSRSVSQPPKTSVNINPSNVITGQQDSERRTSNPASTSSVTNLPSSTLTNKQQGTGLATTTSPPLLRETVAASTSSTTTEPSNSSNTVDQHPDALPANEYQPLIQKIDQFLENHNKEIGAVLNTVKRKPKLSPEEEYRNQVLTAFFKTIPIIGDVSSCKKHLPKLKSFINTFLKTKPSDIPAWSKQYVSSFFLFAIIKNLLSQATHTELGVTPKGLLEYRQLCGRFLSRAERLELLPSLEKIHSDTLKKIKEEVTAINQFFGQVRSSKSSSSSSSKTKEMAKDEEQYLLKAYYLLQSSYPGIVSARQDCKSKDIFDALSAHIQQFEKEFPEQSQIIKTCVKQFDADHQTAISQAQDKESSSWLGGKVANFLSGIADFMTGKTSPSKKGAESYNSEFMELVLLQLNDFLQDFIDQFNAQSKAEDVKAWLDNQAKMPGYFFPFQIASLFSKKGAIDELDHKERQRFQKKYPKVQQILTHLKLEDSLNEVSNDMARLILQDALVKIEFFKNFVLNNQSPPDLQQMSGQKKNQGTNSLDLDAQQLKALFMESKGKLKKAVIQALAEIKFLQQHPKYKLLQQKIGEDKFQILFEVASATEEKLKRLGLEECIPTLERVQDVSEDQYAALLC